MCSAANIICIFIFLYCPMTQWGKIKKSESNDGKTDNGREGMVADNLAKNRETKTHALMEPQI